MSHKSVKQKCLTRALRNSVKQGCPTRVSHQCVKSGCLTSEFAGNVINKYCLCLSTYVSAFGFVGFILFLTVTNCRGTKDGNSAAVSGAYTLPVSKARPKTQRWWQNKRPSDSPATSCAPRDDYCHTIQNKTQTMGRSAEVANIWPRHFQIIGHNNNHNNHNTVVGK